MRLELDPVDRITVGAVGLPGQRTFYLQARQGTALVTLLFEKAHVIALARGSEEILTRVGFPEPPMTWDAQTMSLEEPLDPAFRVGSMAIGFVEERDLILLECRELVVEGEPEDPATSRFWLSRAQMRALGEHGMALAAQGRPLCPLCGSPMDAGGHFCVASNGHRKPGED